MSYMEIIPLAKSAKCPFSAIPKLLVSNTEKEPPSWSSFKIVPKNPVTLSETKSIKVRRVNIPDPTTNETNWFELKDDAKIPIDSVEELYKIRPKYPVNIGPKSGTPKINSIIG